MIANLDGDAVPEIVDPWGVPYEFMREPTVMVSIFGNTVAYSINTSNVPQSLIPQVAMRTIICALTSAFRPAQPLLPEISICPSRRRL